MVFKPSFRRQYSISDKNLKTKYAVTVTLVVSTSVIIAIFGKYYIGQADELTSPKVELSIHGLNQTYQAGNIVDFYVHVKEDKGCDSTKAEVLKLPSLNDNITTVVQTNQVDRSCPAGTAGAVEGDWHVGQDGIIGIDKPIILNDTGLYQIRASMADTIVNSTPFSIVSTAPANRYNLSFDGLKDHYRVGEKMDFALKIGGYGSSCGTPNIDIIDKSGATLYTLYKHGSFSCTGARGPLNQTWSLSDLDAENFTLSQAGHYKIVGSYHDAEVTKTIQVKSQ